MIANDAEECVRGREKERDDGKRRDGNFLWVNKNFFSVLAYIMRSIRNLYMNYTYRNKNSYKDMVDSQWA